MKTRINTLVLALGLFFLPLHPAFAAKVQPVKAKSAMVVGSEPIATQIGLEVLKKKGNAIDAAVTMGFAMAVTMPRAGNLGGGGFMMLALKSGKVTTVDYREKAPFAATRDMYLDAEGNPDPAKSRSSHLAVGVPGTVAGLAIALERHGTITLQEALAPAIRLAEEGFIVSSSLAKHLLRNRERLFQYPSTRKIFFKYNREPYKAGDLLIQKDLAWSLQQISQHGTNAFYRGEVGKRILSQIQENEGIMTAEDLSNYYPAMRKPVQGVYRGYNIYSMGPPSSGGLHIVQMLNILEGFPIKKWGHNSTKTVHAMAEAMKYAYADRSHYLGDKDFVRVPERKFISQRYADRQRRKIRMRKAKPSAKIKPTYIRGYYESNQTTHFSVVDAEGNAVSNTYTLNFPYGTGIVAEGTGILLNNEMDDFSAKPGTANAYGLIGGKANQIEPKKRMLSSMSPTIVKRKGKLVLVTGSPGGSRIITTTLQIIMNVIDHRMNLQEAVNAVRIHHQWMPDELRVEEGLAARVIKALEKKGHTVVVKPSMGAAASIYINRRTGERHGASDPRRDGLAVGY